MLLGSRGGQNLLPIIEKISKGNYVQLEMPECRDAIEQHLKSHRFLVLLKVHTINIWLYRGNCVSALCLVFTSPGSITRTLFSGCLNIFPELNEGNT